MKLIKFRVQHICPYVGKIQMMDDGEFEFRHPNDLIPVEKQKPEPILDYDGQVYLEAKYVDPEKNDLIPGEQDDEEQDQTDNDLIPEMEEDEDYQTV